MDEKSEDDRFCEEFLQRDNKCEALSWLKDKTWKERRIGELSHAQSLAIVKTLYDCGAENVIAVDLIDDVKVSEWTEALIVRLPKHRWTRKRVIQWCSAHSIDEGFALIEDHGQSYVFLWWD